MSRDLPGTSGNYLSVGDVAPIDITGTALTICGWIRPDTLGSEDVIASKRDAGSTAFQYELGVTSAGAVFFRVGNGSGTFETASGGTQVATGAWNHICGVKNGTGANALKGYINGVERASVTSNVTIGNTAQNLVFGRISDGDFNILDALLAEVAIWNVSLSASEVAAMARGVSPLLIRRQSLKGYWPLYGTSSPERDYSGQGSSATINGTVNSGTRNPPVMSFAAFPSNVRILVANSITSDDLSNTQTSSQSLHQALAEEKAVSATSTLRISEVATVIISETFVNTQTMSFSLMEGRVPIPVTELSPSGVPQGTQIFSDSVSKHTLENVQEDVVLEVVSIDASPQTVTIETSYAQDGAALDDRIVTIPAGATRYIGKFPRYIYNQEDLVTMYINPSVSGTLKFRAYKA